MLPFDIVEPLNEYVETIVFYAKPKKGKSTVLSKLSQEKKFLILDTENSYSKLKGYIARIDQTKSSYAKFEDLIKLLDEVQKAGTTSLYDWISQHPDIYGPSTVKDFHFFLNDVHYNKGISWLSSFFKDYNKEKIVLQGAVNYIYFSHVADRISKELSSDIKFLLILRNPAKRAWSAYQYFHKNGSENADFRTALDRELNYPYTGVVEKAHFDYIGHGYYFEQISSYLKYFKPEQFKILFYEEIMTDKSNAVRNVFDFLGVDAGFQPKFSKLNLTGKARSRWLNRLLFGNSVLKKILKF